MEDSIVAGLISGLVVTLFVIVFRSIWHRIIVPWFEDRVYKDIRIEGTWFSLYSDNASNRQETISLQRHGHEISGTIICNNGPDEGEKYRVTGSFRNLILALLYEVDDPVKVDRGTMTLRCIRNGQRLGGKVAFYSNQGDIINDCDVTWYRSKEDLVRVLETAKHSQQTDPADR